METTGELATSSNCRRAGYHGSVCREPRAGNLSSGKLSLGKPDHEQKSRRLRNLLGSNPTRLQALPHLFTINSLDTSERTVGAALRGRPAWKSISPHKLDRHVGVWKNYSNELPRSRSAPGGHGGPPLQYVRSSFYFFNLRRFVYHLPRHAFG